jgi:hypothetical protein
VAIYLSGGSGIGKTTFCSKMRDKYGISLVTNVIRELHSKDPGINYLTFNDRQLIYTMEYICHHLRLEQTLHERVLSDRSLLNVLAWWGVNPKVVRHFRLELAKPDLVIILPVPSMQWYATNGFYITGDPVRRDAYLARADIMNILLYDKTDYSVTKLIREQDEVMYTHMCETCSELGWKHFTPRISNWSNFQNEWQERAEDVILSEWNIR